MDVVMCMRSHVPIITDSVMETVCRSGRIGILLYLHTEYELSGVSLHALQLACEYGHVGVVKYIYKSFGYTLEDLLEDDMYCLRWPAVLGHINVIKFLCESVGVDDKIKKELLNFTNNPAIVEYLRGVMIRVYANITDMCPVCMDTIGTEGCVTECGHVYHIGCMRQWGKGCVVCK